VHRARKRFGQNFLHDAGVVDRIVEAIAPMPGETLVEIGPGLGAITRPLIRRCGKLTAIELDSDLIPRLRQTCEPLGSFRLVESDALAIDYSQFAGEGPVRLVGNLPYNISTPLIFHVLSQVPWVQDMHFMLQREVVDRMRAAPGGRDYGRLSVMVQYRCSVQALFDVDPGAFRPRPKVRSTFARLVPHTIPPRVARDPLCLQRVVRTAFGQRRKTLKNALEGLLSSAQIAAVGVDPSSRAQTLDLDAFIALADSLARSDDLRTS